MEVEVRIDCENIQHLGFDYQYLEEKSEQRESKQADKESEDELNDSDNCDIGDILSTILREKKLNY